MRKFDGPAPTFTTARLVLRPLLVEDAPAVQKQFERFEVVRYLNKSVPWPYPPDGALTHLQTCLAQDSERAWAITLEGQLIGAISLCTEGDENRGFWLTPEFWGQGYMTEASDQVTDYALAELGWPDLVTGNAVANAASGQLKRTRGWELIETTTKGLVGGEMQFERWRITRDRWLCRDNPGARGF